MKGSDNMYDVTIKVYSWGKLLRVVRRQVDAYTLKALRTIHGYSNVIINL